MRVLSVSFAAGLFLAAGCAAISGLSDLRVDRCTDGGCGGSDGAAADGPSAASDGGVTGCRPSGCPAGELCCVDTATPATATCAATCSGAGKLGIACEQAADCTKFQATGLLCCGSFDAGATLGVTCQQSDRCVGAVQFCSPSASKPCASGQCVASTHIGGYFECAP